MKVQIGGAAAVLAIAAIGCGSGGDSTEAALTKAQFIKRGDAICTAAQAKKTKAVQAWGEKPANKGKTLADWSLKELSQVYSSVALPPIKEAADELAALSPPAGDAQAQKLVKALDSAVESVEEKPIRAIKDAPYASADRMAQAYGFKVCGLF